MLEIRITSDHAYAAENAPPAAEDEGEDKNNQANQTDLSGAMIAAMQARMQRLLSENQTLKKELSDERTGFDLKIFKNNDEKVKYYTGLPDFSTLQILYYFIEPHIPYSTASALTKFQQLTLCLLKLRLNLAHMDLGQRFGINKSSSSRIFLNMIDVLHKRLKDLIVWPEREELQETMPMSFRVHFGTNVVVIIDCFEVFIDTPSSLGARAWTWSSYKHNNTVKFLIGVTPQGNISFLSKGWGGRTSDMFCITEHCGLLNKLNPGDVVLADRGFDIADSVGMMGATLHIPAFTKGKKQLSGREVESTSLEELQMCEYMLRG